MHAKRIILYVSQGLHFKNMLFEVCANLQFYVIFVIVNVNKISFRRLIFARLRFVWKFFCTCKFYDILRAFILNKVGKTLILSCGLIFVVARYVMFMTCMWLL